MKLKIIFLFLAFTPSALAQQPDGWTLGQCMEYAVANSPRVNSSEAKSEIYRQDHRESVASLFPSLSGNIGGSFGFGRNLGDDNTYTNTNSFSNDMGIGGSLTLFDGLASVYRVKMTKVGRLLGRENLQITKDNVAFETMECFFLVQGHAEMVELCREQLEESARNLMQTEQMAEVGLKGFPDVAEMKAQLAQAQYNLTKQVNLYNINLIRLKEKMNFPLDAHLKIIPYTGDPAMEPGSASAMAIYGYAKDNNPVALSARMQSDYSYYNYKAVRGNLWPSIYLNGGFNTGFWRDMASGHNYESYWSQLRNKRGHYIGFGISIPIFSGLRTASNIKRSALNLRIARNDTELALRELYSNIEQAIADVDGQADEYRQVVMRVEAEELSYRLSLRKYNEGLISAVELHTNSNRLLEARAEMTSSILMYHLKRKQLDYYKGIPFYTEDAGITGK